MPSAVHALAPHPGGRVVAVGREDGDIELAVPSEGYRVEARIPGQEGKGLRSLAWIGEVGGERQGERPAQPQRLFGCGLDGTLFEVDLERLCYKNVRDAFGGAVWCMRASSPLSLLAIGCEDGSLRLFTTEGDGLEYKKSFPSTGSRILSLAWGTTYDVIFAGGADSLIHCFNTSSGQSLVSIDCPASLHCSPITYTPVQTLEVVLCAQLAVRQRSHYMFGRLRRWTRPHAVMTDVTMGWSEEQVHRGRKSAVPSISCPNSKWVPRRTLQVQAWGCGRSRSVVISVQRLGRYTTRVEG